ncbi:unnamed protein product [Hymenolepis diminuta]|uniref:Transmembrane protein 127 transmembrane region domain-containing protein n=1 Tax=Hymenolepis diminuta TaxID=6216 RepID=A0A564Y867_HYMDI|nr:unnamed protein product [Hymenolepis diminuta]
MPFPSVGSRSFRGAPLFLRRIKSLSFSSNLLATLLLCGATVLKSTFTLKDSPCELNSIGFQDIFSFYAAPGDKEKTRFARVLHRCVTSDSVVTLYCCLALIVLSLLCSILQLFANLNVNLGFMRKYRRRGVLDVCCVFINCVCLGLMYWAASSISQFQFDEIKRNLPNRTFTNIEQTRSFIKNATKTMDAFSISFSGGFYFVLLAGLASLVSFATQTCSRSTIALRRQTSRRVEPQRIVQDPAILWCA